MNVRKFRGGFGTSAIGLSSDVAREIPEPAAKLEPEALSNDGTGVSKSRNQWTSE